MDRKRGGLNLVDWEVQKSPCETCPFAGKNPVQLDPARLAGIYQNLLGNGQHFCHSVNNQKICRGGRDIQLRWMVYSGYLDEATDEALEKAIRRYVHHE